MKENEKKKKNWKLRIICCCPVLWAKIIKLKENKREKKERNKEEKRKCLHPFVNLVLMKGLNREHELIYCMYKIS